MDRLFLQTIEFSYTAQYTPKERKIPFLQKAAATLDLVKLFLRIAWETDALENKKYIAVSKELDEAGKMLGGWLRKMVSQSAEHSL